MTRARTLALTAGLAALTPLVLTAPATAEQPAPRTYTATLGTLNDSGVTGTAELTLDRNTLTVRIQASGVEANKVHPQHIHGLDDAKANAACPPAAAADDIANSPEEADNPDNYISVPEGAPFYGSILRPLTPFPTPKTTTIDVTRTYSGGELAKLQPIKKTLQNRVIVLHGDTLDNGDYLATLPVACGQIKAG